MGVFEFEIVQIIAGAITSCTVIFTAGGWVIKRMGDQLHRPLLDVMGNLIVADCATYGRHPSAMQRASLIYAFAAYKQAGGNGAVESTFNNWLKEIEDVS